MADEDDNPEAPPTAADPPVPAGGPDPDPDPLPPVGDEATKLTLLREAGHDVTDEGLADARARLDRAASTVTAESRVESRERVREIMGWS